MPTSWAASTTHRLGSEWVAIERSAGEQSQGGRAPNFQGWPPIRCQCQKPRVVVPEARAEPTPIFGVDYFIFTPDSDNQKTKIPNSPRRQASEAKGGTESRGNSFL